MGACGVRSPTMGFAVAADLGNAVSPGYRSDGSRIKTSPA